jgi:hypothetical protein
MVQLTCPPPEQITQFVLGKLGEDQAQQVSNRWFWELVGVAGTIALLVLGGRLAMDRLGYEAPAVAVVPGAPYPDPVPREKPATSIGPDPTPSLWGAPSPPSDPHDGASSALPEPEASVSGPAEPESEEPEDPEPIRVTITSQRPGYLYLLAQDADGTMWCLFPNDHEDDNRIEPGRPVTLSGSGRGFELRAGLKQDPETGAEARVEIATRSGDGAEPGAVGVGEVEEANG